MTVRTEFATTESAHNYPPRELGVFLLGINARKADDGRRCVRLPEQAPVVDIRKKDEAQEVRDPAMVLHCHVTPSDWSKYVGESEAAGRLVQPHPSFLLGSVPLLDDDRVSVFSVAAPG
ncbi:hypothetical protein ACIRBZ_12750 [Streptomyces sp. NPDC094038]|uniref:hypothetical protein n=1 Tax=Streptomyces sp. NPDC094038 TaxID=3366055 RepID=UPI0038163979